jgi:hypothetical protein
MNPTLKIISEMLSFKDKAQSIPLELKIFIDEQPSFIDYSQSLNLSI